MSWWLVHVIFHLCDQVSIPAVMAGNSKKATIYMSDLFSTEFL